MNRRIRNDFFGLYKGSEYRIVRSFKCFVKIITDNVEISNKGFRESRPGLFTKWVCKGQIDSAYYIRSYITYKGDEFSYLGENAHVVFGTTYDKKVGERHHARPSNDWDYRVEIPWSEVETVIERREKINLEKLRW